MLIRIPFWLAPRRPAPICRPDRAETMRMAWTAEDRREDAPAIQEVLRQGMIVRLVRTMDALDPQPRVGRERVWSTLIRLQALWHLARDGGDHRHPEREDRPAAGRARVRRRQEGEGPQAGAAGRHRGRPARHSGRPG